MVLDEPNDTDKRFPRSTREAFGDERGQWFEPPEDDGLKPLLAGLVCCALSLIVAVLLYL